VTRELPPQQPLLVSKADAAQLLSISIDTLERLVMPEVRLVRIGRRVLFAVRDLQRWVDGHAALPLSSELARDARRNQHPNACVSSPARRSTSSRGGAIVAQTKKTGRRGGHRPAPAPWR
jgi:hypothetical protein